MKVLYDNEIFDMQRIGGISNSFVQLIKHLPVDIKAEICLKGSENQYILEEKLTNGFFRGFKSCDFLPFLSRSLASKVYNCLEYRCKRFPTINRVNDNYSNAQISKQNYDVFHSTFYCKDFWKRNKKPYVVTIHDMTPEIYGFEKLQQDGKREQVEVADKIITVSENTKRDLVRILNVPEEKVEVIYHGFITSDVSIIVNPIVTVPYILYVGGRWSYKNFPYFVEQLSHFISRHNDFRVICTGGPFNQNEIELLIKYKVQDKFETKFCTTDELNNLYKYAFAFVYPSLYEGFGMPILEAYNAGCPVILNNKSCFPEIAADAALYFDSDNENNNLDVQLEDLYNSSTEDKSALIKKEQLRLQSFSWDESAKKLACVYRKLV